MGSASCLHTGNLWLRIECLQMEGVLFSATAMCSWEMLATIMFKTCHCCSALLLVYLEES